MLTRNCWRSWIHKKFAICFQHAIADVSWHILSTMSPLCYNEIDEAIVMVSQGMIGKAETLVERAMQESLTNSFMIPSGYTINIVPVTPRPCSEIQSSSLNGEGFLFYNSLFRIDLQKSFADQEPCSSAASNDKQRNDYHTLTAFILYNFAFLCHLKFMGASPHENSCENGRKALKLYKAALRALSMADTEVQQRCSLLLNFAIINNMSHIFYRRLDRTKFVKLVHVMEVMAHETDPDQDDLPLFQDFYLNIWVARELNKSHAAAAWSL